MPKPSVWGPALWNLLHGIGYRAGKGPEKTRIDEKREISWLLNNLETIIPCQECRTHYRNYKKTVSLEKYDEWIWQLHESVNQKLGKDGVPFSVDIGEPISVRQSWKIYKNILREYVLANGSVMNEYGRHIGLWAGFAGI